MEIVDGLKEKFNMSESKRRSHVGMDVAFWSTGGLGNGKGLGAYERTRKRRAH